ncbi:MAG: aminotransferase class III-fold pyridoxal phosphate-dependent enzyme [Pseudomonadota bacterium]
MIEIPISLAMQEQAKKFIPGKTQLLSKRPEMFAPGVWPGYYSKAKGQEVWDLDRNHYLDFSIAGIGANILGYADDYVDGKVIDKIRNGSSSSLNCPEEIELAQLICKIHPWIEMVRYSRSGGEAVSIAIRIARAFTRKDKVIFCGYHGWHDWYLSTNISNGNNLSSHLLPGLSPLGVPANLEGTAIPFHYNDINELKKILSLNKGKVAAVIMEPIGSYNPEDGFLQEVKDLAEDNEAVLIFDEISSGFRINYGGAHLKLNIEPDLVVFSKAISNGYPMGIVAGKAKIMESAQETFISSTSWTEGTGPTATIATLNKFAETNAHEHLIKIGNIVSLGWTNAAKAANLNISISGLPSLKKFHFEHEKDLVMRTFFTQEMMEVGFLAAGRFYSMLAHTFEAAESYVYETSKIFLRIAELLDSNSLEKQLRGGVAHNGFRRLS